MAEELSEETFPCTLLAFADYSKTLVTNHNWHSDEGANTALFHAQAQYRKQKNFVAQIVANGQVYTEQVQKAGIIDEFYFSLLGQNAARESTINLESRAMIYQSWTLLFLRKKCGVRSRCCHRTKRQSQMVSLDVSIRLVGQ